MTFLKFLASYYWVLSDVATLRNEWAGLRWLCRNGVAMASLQGQNWVEYVTMVWMWCFFFLWLLFFSFSFFCSMWFEYLACRLLWVINTNGGVLFIFEILFWDVQAPCNRCLFIFIINNKSKDSLLFNLRLYAVTLFNFYVKGVPIWKGHDMQHGVWVKLDFSK